MLSRIFGIRSETKKKVLEIQNGNDELRNEFINESINFIVETISKILKKNKKFIHESDEYSIGLIAFNEAINSYEIDSDASFKTFASMVIKRRIIDYLRKENRLNVDEDNITDTEESASYSLYLEERGNIERIDEISNFTLKLAEFSIKFTELANEVPKHIDAKRNAIMIAEILSKEKKLKDELYEKKRLPIKELLNHLDVSKKTLERNRKYIIAMAIILIEDYHRLKEFLKV